MRASACKQEILIDADSFVGGQCPHAVTSPSTPDDSLTTTRAPATTMTELTDEGSGDESDDEDDERADGETSRKRGEDDPHEDSEEDEESTQAAGDPNERPGFQSKLCRNVICPIGALCKVTRRRQPYCDCSHMCQRIEQLSLATTWIKSPVCGSNGLRYPNECRLRQDACTSNTTITVLTDCRLNTSFAPASGDNNHRPNDLLG